MLFNTNRTYVHWSMCAISPLVLAAAAVSYLSVSSDFFILVELDRFFHMLSACVCSVCLSVCVFLTCCCVFVCTSRNMSAIHFGLWLCECAYRNMQECLCCRLWGHQQFLISSDQTRQWGGEHHDAVVCCGSDLGHGLGLCLNEKWNSTAARP